MSDSVGKKIQIALSAIGPGLFLIGYNIGTGSITTMGVAGARYGMTMLWALVLSGIITYILMVTFGKLTLVTGKTALFNFKTEIKSGKILALYIMVALILGELLSLIGVMGIVAELMQEGIRLASAEQSLVVNTIWIILGIVILAAVGFWYGRYKLFEKVLTLLVILMVLCFGVVFFIISPSFSDILGGLIPRIPDTQHAFRVVAAMAGTTASAAVFIIRSVVVSEKGWTINHLKSERRDAFVSAFMMVLLSGLVMAVSAGTLHVMGLDLETTLEMISLFAPIGGDLAAFLLIIGISGAGITTILPIVLIAPWLVADYMGWERDIHSPLFRVLILGGLLISFGSVFLEQTPTFILVFAMSLQAVILPAIAIPSFYLLNKEELMGKQHLPSRKWNLGLILVILFSLLTTYFAIESFFK